MNTTPTQDPATIEGDIRRTQDDMSRTVDRLGDQLTAKNLVNSLLDKADENGIDARYLIEGARRNPVALGLIAAGAIWLVSDKDSKLPSMPSKLKRGSNDENEWFGGSDVHHRDYVAHMSAVEMHENEDPLAYQRRRDLHRANFLMCERRPDEDEHGFRQRLDDLTETFRNKRQAWMDSTSQSASATRQSAQRAAAQVSTRARDMYGSNPLVGGMLAAAVGAAVGSSIPVSRTEQQKLGGIGAKARDLANEQKDQLGETFREKKDELLEKADRKLEEGGRPASGGQTFGSDGQQGSEAAFILPERS